MNTIDVVLNPPEIDHLPGRDLGGSVAVVFDVLRATTSMVTALAHGAAGVWPVATIEEAWDLREKKPGALLGGERRGERIEGFDLGNSPLEYTEAVAGREIISTTTNGTVALRAASHAHCMIAASLLNIGATAGRLADAASVVIVCAGTFRDTALEDVLAAGLLISLLPGRLLTDSARVALAAYRQDSADLGRALRAARNGRALIAKGREREIEWCAQVSRYDLVATMDPDGCIRCPPVNPP